MKQLLLLFLIPCSLSASWHYDGEGGKLEIDSEHSGRILQWETEGQRWISNPAGAGAPGFSASSAREGKSGVTLKGTLAGGEPATLTYRVEDEGRRLRVELEREKGEGLSWQQPLSLQPRKRIWYRGDRGHGWETRYFYQFMSSTFGSLLPVPDRNEWRYFELEQRAPTGFRLWRSESEQTAPLIMQQGERAEPRVQVFDERGGVTLALEGKPAPYALRVDAAGGASVEVSLPKASRAEWNLTAHPSEDAVLAARGGGTADRPDPADALREPSWLRETAASGPQVVSGGYPFARGALAAGEAVRVLVAGKPVPVQAKPLAFWPDGSVKWSLLTFPIDPAQAVAKAEPPRVSLRDGRFLPVEVATGGKAVAAPETVQVEQPSPGKVVVTNGALQATLGTGPKWLESLRWQGEEQFAFHEGTRLAYSDYRFNPESVPPFAQALVGGTEDRGVLSVDSVTVEESGPLRAVVRLEGLTNNTEPTRIILRLEFLAGHPQVRLTHTAVFRFADPRKTWLTGLGVELPLAKEGRAIRFGGVTGQRVPSPARLVQETPLYGVLQTLGREAGLGRSPGWGESGGVFGMIRNFWQQAPAAVGFTKDALKLEFWPADAPPMEMRRYSQWPHPAQGESAAPDAGWVERVYYAQGPVYGLSRTHEALLAFGDGGQPLAADFQSPPLLYAGWAAYRPLLLPSAEKEQWPRAWENWTRLAQFWLHHRALYEWYGFWHFGDVRHRFRHGYGSVATPEALAAGRPWEIEKWTKAVNRASRLDRSLFRVDYRPENDWAFDNGRWGWSNTEGLPGLFFQHEYLRHGNRAVYFAAEALGRHSRDVVTRQEGPLLGVGTRHGVQHWSDGNHEERQTTITEYRLHYFLSGEPRSREVLETLYQEVYSKKKASYAAAHSGRLGGLLFHWEVTGDAAEAEQLHRYTRLFLEPGGLNVAPVAIFPALEKRGEPQGLNDGTMFFQTFGGMHALLEYQQLMNDAEIASAVVGMADHVLKTPDLANRYRQGKSSASMVYWPALAFAARHAKEPAPYRALLEAYLHGGKWADLYQTVSRNPAHWSGPTAFLESNVSGGMFWNNWAPMIAWGLGEKELWSEAMATAFEKREAEGEPVAPWRPGWQTEYDAHPELHPYLGVQQPWAQ